MVRPAFHGRASVSVTSSVHYLLHRVVRLVSIAVVGFTSARVILSERKAALRGGISSKSGTSRFGLTAGLLDSGQ